MRRYLKLGPAGIGLLLVMATIGPVTAAPSTTCGMVVTVSTTLTADIGPCGRGGIIIAADNIRVDLGGHRIFGKDKSGDGVGVLFNGTHGSWVSNGTVTGFDAGVAIVGGDSNTVTHVTIRDNIGSLTAVRPAYGDGVAIRNSSYNWIFNNDILNNGPFSGVAIFTDGGAVAETNVIDRNRVVDNDIARATTNDDIGIRVEGPNALGTYIKQNRVLGSGFDGIAVFEAPGSSNASTWIDTNVVQVNGFHSLSNRQGDGIHLADQADSSLLYDNEVNNNAANGIFAASVSNMFSGNTALNNGLYPGSGGYDLFDANDGCADNIWTSRSFGTVNQSCVM